MESFVVDINTSSGDFVNFLKLVLKFCARMTRNISVMLVSNVVNCVYQMHRHCNVGKSDPNPQITML